MAAADNQQLNQLLIRLYRSLLQYTEECWPWSGTRHVAAERAIIDSLSRAQKQSVSWLVGLLAARGWSIEFSNYPTDYTDLHYVSLDFLLSQLVAQEEALVADLSRALASAEGDAEAAAVLKEILDQERSGVERLRELSRQQQAA
jgi:hypothetical protein